VPVMRFFFSIVASLENLYLIPVASVLILWCNNLSGGFTMEWTTPTHEEIDLNCEISSYANAEL